MAANIAQTIYEKVQILPAEEQMEVLGIVEDKISFAQKKDTRPIWEVITEISQVSEEEWAKLPADGSVNHDHYLYGAPKKAK